MKIEIENSIRNEEEIEFNFNNATKKLCLNTDHFGSKQFDEKGWEKIKNLGDRFFKDDTPPNHVYIKLPNQMSNGRDMCVSLGNTHPGKIRFGDSESYYAEIDKDEFFKLAEYIKNFYKER